MRKKTLKLAVPVLALAASLAGLFSPKPAHAGGVCDYFCLDPELTCCITCYWMGGSCVCPDFCTDGL